MAFLSKKRIDDQGSKDFPEFPSSFAPDLKFPEFPGASEDDNPYKDNFNKESIDQFKISNKQSPYEDILDKPLTHSPMAPMNNQRQLSMDETVQQRPMNYSQRVQQQPSFPNMGPTMGPRPIMPMGPQPEESRRVFHEDRPLFVKIDDYEEAIFTLDKIKAKIKEADRILEELSKIRSEEERQLEEWRRDLDLVKEKLLLIDRQLFENS